MHRTILWWISCVLPFGMTLCGGLNYDNFCISSVVSPPTLSHLSFCAQRQTSSIITYYHNSSSWFYTFNPIFMMIGFFYFNHKCTFFFRWFRWMAVRFWQYSFSFKCEHCSQETKRYTFRCGTACTLSLKKFGSDWIQFWLLGWSFKKVQTLVKLGGTKVGLWCHRP